MGNVYLLAEEAHSRKESRAKAKKYRQKVMIKSLFHCQVCGYPDPTFGELLKIHHIVEVRRGGHGGMSNLVAICSNCHTCVHEFAHRKFKSDGELFSTMTFDKRIEVVKRYGYGNKAARRMVLLASQNCYVHKKLLIRNGIHALDVEAQKANPSAATALYQPW